MPDRVRHIIGCMTGTSLDGLDAVLTRIDGEGLAMKATFVRMASRPFADELRQTLRSLASAEAHPAEDYVRAARALGEFHAEVIGELMDSGGEPPAEPGAKGVDFVVAHGQTIFHAGDAHLSWQLFDPWPIVRKCGVPVCYDLRQADLIAGGQGAPITPIADWVMYREDADCVVNLGGIVNITELHKKYEKVDGYDVGPGNILIDGLCQRLFGEPFDRDGSYSAQGEATGYPMAHVAEAILDQPETRTLGREQFTDTWFDKLADRLRNECTPGEGLRGAVEYVANSIFAMTARWFKQPRVVLAGGGARNLTLVAATRERVGPSLFLSDDLGIPCEAREAMAFAVLGALSQDKVPITLPRVTGSENPGVAGAWVYP